MSQSKLYSQNPKLYKKKEERNEENFLTEQSCIPKILSFIKKEERKKENFLTEPEHLSITLDQTR